MEFRIFKVDAVGLYILIYDMERKTIRKGNSILSQKLFYVEVNPSKLEMLFGIQFGG